MKRNRRSPRPVEHLRITNGLPDVILHPVQFDAIWNGNGVITPERALALAVLNAAVDDLQKYRHARRRRPQRLYSEAYRWVAAHDPRWPFSFVNICEALRLSPDALRAQLLSADLDEVAAA